MLARITGHDAYLYSNYRLLIFALVNAFFLSEMYVFDLYKKCIQSNNETILDQGTRIKTSLVANIRAAYYIINNCFSYHKLKIHNKVRPLFMIMPECHYRV